MDEPPRTWPLSGLPPVFGATFTLLIRLSSDRASAAIDDEVALEQPLEGLADATSLTVHFPEKEESLGKGRPWVLGVRRCFILCIGSGLY